MGGGAAQRLADHVLGRDLDAEERRAHARDAAAALLERAFGGERGRRADELQGGVADALAHAAQEHGDVGALPAAIDVQLVEHKERRLFGGQADQRALVGPQQHVLEHHVVGQQNVGWIVQDRLALFVFILAGVPVEADGAVGPVALPEPPERVKLAVHQGVHRVDDDSADGVARRLIAHDCVDDGDEIGEALARAGAGGDDVGVAPAPDAERLFLMVVQSEAGTKEPRCVVGDQPLPREFGQRGAGQKGRVELQHGVWPELAFLQTLSYEGGDTVVGDVDEAFKVLAVLVDDPLAERKDVHGHLRGVFRCIVRL